MIQQERAARVEEGTPPPTHRLAFLDAARGIGATAVVLQHTFELVVPGFAAWAVHHGDAGALGVVLFFLVSGFIIPVSLRRAASPRLFWTNRFFRLYPMYWASLLGALMLAFVLRLYPLPTAYLAHPVAATLANVTMLQAFVREPDAIGPYWTLPLEMVFYVLCTVLYALGWLGRSVACAWAAAGGLALLTVVAALGWHASLPAGRLGMLVCAFFGTVVYDFAAGTVPRRALLVLTPAVLLSLLLAFWFRFRLYPAEGHIGSWDLQGVVVSWTLAFTVFFLLFILRRRAFPRALLFLGRISYSLYLLHGPVMAVVPRSLGAPGYPIAVLIVSVALSAVTYRYIEQPMIALHRLRSRAT